LKVGHPARKIRARFNIVQYLEILYLDMQPAYR
jgi:hypothetical protein